MIGLRVLFIAFYLTVDILYVTYSRPVYESVVSRIQQNSKGFPSLEGSRIAAAVIAYASMAFGWYVLAAFYVESQIERIKGIELSQALLIGATSGLAYGLLVYGVFNGTLHVMFEKYDTKIALRDIAWGVSWSTILTTIYSLAVFKQQS